MHHIPMVHAVTSVLQKRTGNAFGRNKKFYYILYSFADKDTVGKLVFALVSSDFLCS